MGHRRQVPCLKLAQVEQIKDSLDSIKWCTKDQAIVRDTAYIIAFARFLIEVMAENGGRWMGFHKARIQDIVLYFGLPLFVCTVDPKKGNKTRIQWQTRASAAALANLLKWHPAHVGDCCSRTVADTVAKHGNCILFADPWKHDANAICYAVGMQKIYRRIKSHCGLPFLPGSNVWRVYRITTANAFGMSLREIQMGVGQVQGSLVTFRYIRFEDEHVLAIGRGMDFLDTAVGALCQCGEPVPRNQLLCPECRSLQGGPEIDVHLHSQALQAGLTFMRLFGVNAVNDLMRNPRVPS